MLPQVALGVLEFYSICTFLNFLQSEKVNLTYLTYLTAEVMDKRL